MAIFNRKKKITNKTARIIFCVAMYAIIALFIAGLFLFNSNYSEIYDSPRVRDGKVNFADVDIPSRDVACNLAGEWEFFYNKWIVTDGYTGRADGLIALPGLWTYKDYGSGSLPKTGFASYRLYAENVQSDIDLIVYRHYGNFAYRVFINGELNYGSGIMSKNAKETVVTGNTDERRPYKTDGSPLEIVIEVSAMNVGGFNAAPWLAATTTGNSYGTNLRSFNYIALGITTAAVVISILTFIFFQYERDITGALLMIALYAHFLFSKDMLYVFEFRITAAMIAQFLSAIVTFVMTAVHFRQSGACFKKSAVTATAVSAAALAVSVIAFYGTPLSVVFAFLLFAVGCAYLVPIVFSEKLTTFQRVIYGILFVFLMSVFCFELCDGLGMLVFGTEFIFTVELMLIIACFAVLWLWKMAKTARVAIRVSELECELSSVKRQALKAQIKPHFVYNSLTAIQARYRDGLDEGDKAIGQFAAHLRLITDSNERDMIPFEDEVRNVLNYFELENLRAGGKLELLLDLNYTEFSIPVLSLQPFVENAIRHGGLREMKNGCIRLFSDKTDSGLVIEISDNGKGFDTNSVCEGVGIQNTRKRFELMNANLQIFSETGCGTRVKIEISSENINENHSG